MQNQPRARDEERRNSPQRVCPGQESQAISVCMWPSQHTNRMAPPPNPRQPPPYTTLLKLWCVHKPASPLQPSQSTRCNPPAPVVPPLTQPIPFLLFFPPSSGIRFQARDSCTGQLDVGIVVQAPPESSTISFNYAHTELQLHSTDFQLRSKQGCTIRSLKDRFDRFDRTVL